MPATIHPTAIVSPNAKIGSNVSIGPFAVIEDDVIIGDDSIIGQNACIYNGARIGNRVKIFQGASVSNLPQDLKYNGEETFLFIGDDTIVREFATLHKGTTARGKTVIGQNCLLMAYTHVAHDCIIGNKVICSNGVQIAGHVTIEDNVIIGGLSAVHQFGKIGQHAMVGGGSMVNMDVPPFVMTSGYPARYMGLNIVGLRRRNFSNDSINAIKEAYRILYLSGLTFRNALDKLKSEFQSNEYVGSIVKFIETSKRGILRR
ncbi:UDP-N-acetylglucosamine acyltransferase [Melioribacter roseus P3M-2]|uniref:Acyl-[acyl-carrier-protein]--UDP-N-acetylglucosamine O-acyltransferase n=1 Tax=Melioribacter roseus (strain DSM 23840 / JCM 17771 / VKM B-2668 / P3M-2) TaxID=1191523 RepID=I6YX07_MELRP|nr:acyl-ACP--UDP-N-acetylglucosamine O-acyltransferase [Melioribacter roseus]AFN75112.1 UDP-N-acetylglucosamine acyltransferase [Melioribacter roseus P3M-2]